MKLQLSISGTASKLLKVEIREWASCFIAAHSFTFKTNWISFLWGIPFGRAKFLIIQCEHWSREIAKKQELVLYYVSWLTIAGSASTNGKRFLPFGGVTTVYTRNYILLCEYYVSFRGDENTSVIGRKLFQFQKMGNCSQENGERQSMFCWQKMEIKTWHRKVCVYSSWH